MKIRMEQTKKQTAIMTDKRIEKQRFCVLSIVVRVTQNEFTTQISIFAWIFFFKFLNNRGHDDSKAQIPCSHTNSKRRTLHFRVGRLVQDAWI